jgi:anti-sigma B factor antagonist
MDPKIPVAFSLGPAVDAQALAALEADVVAATDDGTRHMTIDLGRLTTLDPVVISALIRMRRGVRELGGHISLAVGRKAVRETLRVTALDKLFVIVESAA